MRKDNERKAKGNKSANSESMFLGNESRSLLDGAEEDEDDPPSRQRRNTPAPPATENPQPADNRDDGGSNDETPAIEETNKV